MNQQSQTSFITINDTLRLKKYDGDYEMFLAAYQDPYVYQNSEGIFDDHKKPNLDYVKGMCEYLSSAGELYVIETFENGTYLPIGDVTVRSDNPPICIWFAKYRRKGIGKLVMATVISRLKELGYKKINGSTVYKWNLPSQKLHESLGFIKVRETETEFVYDLDII
ncbi:MAG: GNAT family N-acetyltransferase [Clostridia bacterium]|nr:GNAT family N-acetyltransferase [Clostridia bacterium]